MLYINVPDMNDSLSALSIDGVEYRLRFTYNERHDFWSFGLYDENENPIISQTRIVPNFPIMFYYTDTEMPDGIFGCVTNQETVGREDFNNENAEFIYIPKIELEV